MDDWTELTIGEVAQRAGVATSTIRYYESIGLLPPPGRLNSQRRYHTEVLGKLGFIGVAQGAGFKLEEIKELVAGVEAGEVMSGQMRSLSSRKLDEVEALLERTKAMKGWLEVAKECGCETLDECALFPAPGEESAEVDIALTLVQVQGADCRRHPGLGKSPSATVGSFGSHRGLKAPTVWCFARFQYRLTFQDPPGGRRSGYRFPHADLGRGDCRAAGAFQRRQHRDGPRRRRCGARVV